MVDSILRAAGIPGRCSRFVKPPAGTYAVWLDGVTTDGPDGMPPMIFTHDISVELYTNKPDPSAEAALEREMSSRGLHWTSEDRVWIQSEQFYQKVYNFSYTEKRRT